MNRNIDFLTQQSLFEFLRKQSPGNFRPRLAKADIETPITGRTDDPDTNLRPLQEPLQSLFDEVDLSQSQLAAASPKDYTLHVRGHSITAGAIPL
jgi:hypothetical protein